MGGALHLDEVSGKKRLNYTLTPGMKLSSAPCHTVSGNLDGLPGLLVNKSHLHFVLQKDNNRISIPYESSMTQKHLKHLAQMSEHGNNSIR